MMELVTTHGNRPCITDEAIAEHIPVGHPLRAWIQVHCERVLRAEVWLLPVYEESE